MKDNEERRTRRNIMIRRKDECSVEYNEHLRGGDGTVKLTQFIASPDDLCGKGRSFARVVLNPGCSIGYHGHETDSELYYILKGTAEYNDNGTLKTVTEGDVTICPPGEGHGIANKSEDVVELIAVIVYA
ncbi:MAG TPA: cupin domain-containing protein [Erysipelotrichaceae bacterium]|nr:cupin domain-containing protein [Erysipelotrichaceae bacterium]